MSEPAAIEVESSSTPSAHSNSTDAKATDAKATDAKASERVALQFADALRSYIARRAPSEDVDDIVQEALLRVHRGLPNRRDLSESGAGDTGELEHRRLASWVYAVTRSALVDHLRRARPHEALPEELGAAPADAEDLVAAEVASWLRPMIESLEPRHREALQQVELDGMSQRELAASLGLSPSGARSRVQRARAALREAVERCCAIELDARNRVADYTPRPGCC